jgi:hypothetical protein
VWCIARIRSTSVVECRNLCSDSTGFALVIDIASVPIGVLGDRVVCAVPDCPPSCSSMLLQHSDVTERERERESDS